jgi:AcrR family transcriptional regulator
MKKPRSYNSAKRSQAASETRERILDASRDLFGRAGIDAGTIAEVAAEAGVAVSTVYALFASKTGILRALMERAIFNGNYEQLLARLETVEDPIERLRLTASVASAIWQGEAREISLLRGSSAFSPELKEIEAEFETRRYTLQRARIEGLAAAGLLRPGLTVKSARDITWMLSSRDVFRMLVIEAHWSAQAYEEWLAETLVSTLTRP